MSDKIKITKWEIIIPGSVEIDGSENVISYFEEGGYIEVSNNIVTNSPDAYIWMNGHCFGTIKSWVKVRGGTITKVKHEGNIK